MKTEKIKQLGTGFHVRAQFIDPESYLFQFLAVKRFLCLGQFRPGFWLYAPGSKKRIPTEAEGKTWLAFRTV